MNKKTFNKEALNTISKYGLTFNQMGYAFMDTSFGQLSIKVEKTNHIELYSLFMRFTSWNKEYLPWFYRYFSKNESINRFTGKWNLHSRYAWFIINELDQRLDNLEHIFQRDGIVSDKNEKPFLEEIESN